MNAPNYRQALAWWHNEIDTLIGNYPLTGSPEVCAQMRVDLRKGFNAFMSDITDFLTAYPQQDELVVDMIVGGSNILVGGIQATQFHEFNDTAARAAAGSMMHTITQAFRKALLDYSEAPTPN